MRLNRSAGTGDGGFALVEVIVASMLTVVVATAALVTLNASQTRQRDLDEVAASQEELHATMTEILRDARAADPLWFETSAAPATRLGMKRLDASSGTTGYVRWRVDGASLAREKVTLDPSTHAVTSATVTRRLAGLDLTIPPFAYFDSAGHEITGATTAPYVDCSVRLMVTLRAAPMASHHAVTVISQADLRNRAASAWWCP